MLLGSQALLDTAVHRLPMLCFPLPQAGRRAGGGVDRMRRQLRQRQAQQQQQQRAAAEAADDSDAEEDEVQGHLWQHQQDSLLASSGQQQACRGTPACNKQVDKGHGESCSCSSVMHNAAVHVMVMSHLTSTWAVMGLGCCAG